MGYYMAFNLFFTADAFVKRFSGFGVPNMVKATNILQDRRNSIVHSISSCFHGDLALNGPMDPCPTIPKKEDVGYAAALAAKQAWVAAASPKLEAMVRPWNFFAVLLQRIHLVLSSCRQQELQWTSQHSMSGSWMRSVLCAVWFQCFSRLISFVESNSGWVPDFW